MSSVTSPPEKPTVLAVDDTVANLEILKEILSPRYRVMVAKSGRQALEALEKAATQPSLILLDIMMPDMDGFQTLARLRSQPRGHDIPVMFLSALGDTEAKTRGFGLGAVDYVTKPFDPPEVLARVETHISLYRARRELAEKNEALEEAARLREDIENITRHDLKSPLNIILATAQFEAEILPEGMPTLKESLEVIGESALKLLSMINLSLDLFKMERGMYRFEAQNVDLVNLLSRLQRDLKALVKSGGLSLRIPPEGDAPFEVAGEPLLCYSLLGNLLRNALEAAPPASGVSVSLGTAVRPDGTPWKVLTIENEGEIPLELRPKLFRKFATSGKSGGTGLGLYSASLIARTMGATIEADSSTAGRTRFHVSFPPWTSS